MKKKIINAVKTILELVYASTFSKQKLFFVQDNNNKKMIAPSLAL